MGAQALRGDRPPAFLSRASLAAELDMDDATLSQIIADGVIPGPCADGQWRWAEVERAINNITRSNALGIVYFVGFGQYVKIGHTTRALEERLAVLQTGCPEKIEVFATLRGRQSDERELHRRFSAYRTFGEWFRREGALATFLHDLREGGAS